ncbi:aromatic ring-hydroxylating dioxygenase subunit alpha [Aquisediminimonas profunda]|uniref:aromatic ring-hydroxylating dioxygenase subunit alpha n=1 Tax=Aquisediminimonas profunda TaxID=1550733 RepID=UPI0024848962|nr:aromatic ring-hydroxylating dioxygenase subunit alpha [Aquisediminimonas profunda]
MYPFRNDKVWLQNAWYVAVMAEEVADKPLQRTILGRPVVLFRGESGKVHAMHGLCPHRNYPLGLHGKVIGEAIQCNYHGFVFDGASGQTVSTPSASDAPKSFCQKTYRVEERGPWIWIWMGDKALADDAQIPSLEALKLDERYTISPMMDYMHVDARYMLLIENLMDLTHIGFLHSMTAAFAEIVNADIDIVEDDKGMRIRRTMEAKWSLYHDAVFGPELRFDGAARSDNEAIVAAVGYCLNTSQTLREIDGRPVGPEFAGEIWFHHVCTPETTNSFHYFGTQSRTIKRDDPDLGMHLREADARVRAEDIEAMEAIERQLAQFGEPEVELLVKSDVPAGRLRRRIQRALDREAGALERT